MLVVCQVKEARIRELRKLFRYKGLIFTLELYRADELRIRMEFQHHLDPLEKFFWIAGDI